MKYLVIIAPVALIACAQPEPITDYNAPYMAGKGDIVRPMPRPEKVAQRRWLACPEAAFNDDCGGGYDTGRETDSGGRSDPGRPDVGAPADRPTRSDSVEPEPAPEPPVSEPEPEPEPEEEWCE